MKTWRLATYGLVGVIGMTSLGIAQAQREGDPAPQRQQSGSERPPERAGRADRREGGDGQDRPDRQERPDRPDRFPGGPGFMPHGVKTDVALLDKYDANHDGYLNDAERPAARAEAKTLSRSRPGPFGPPGRSGRPDAEGPSGRREAADRPGRDERDDRRGRDDRGDRNRMAGRHGPHGAREPFGPGEPLTPSQVESVAGSDLYAPDKLRTLFLNFSQPDWEQELEDFHGTDVDVPAQMTVDGKEYPNVGVHFRGMSSYMAVGAGHKRSLNVSMDLANADQRLYGYKTLNLLNAHGDPSFLSSVLYSRIARDYLATPKANLVRVVINGEDWGIYTNVQQFDKIFTKENFDSAKGARWKVPGSPGAKGGLEYLGDDVAPYQQRYEIKTKDKASSWEALVTLCKTLNETPADQLPAAIEPMLDIDSTLWFLALDITLLNSDGYWIRSSDYSIYLDPDGKFHFVPHDMNEAFQPGHGPGPRGPRGQVGQGGPGGEPRLGMALPFLPGGPGFFDNAPPFPPHGMGGFFGDGPPPFPPPPGTVMPRPVQEMLQLTLKQRAELDKLQATVDERLDQILSAEQKRQLAAFPPPPGSLMAAGGPPPFAAPSGPGGMPGGGAGNALELDPLVGMDDPSKPLRSKLLAVPQYRQRYLEHVRAIAETWLDWKKLGPIVAEQHDLIAAPLRADHKKLSSIDDFERMTSQQAEAQSSERSPNQDRGMRDGRPGRLSIRSFAEQRRDYLLQYFAKEGKQ